RGQRRRADAIGNGGEWKMQEMRLVQRDLERSRGDLDRAGKAARRRQDDREAIGRNGTFRGYNLEKGAGWRAVDFEYEDALRAAVAIAKLAEELLLGGQTPAGPRSECKKVLA